MVECSFIPIYRHLLAHNLVRELEPSDMPIGVSRGFRVHLGKESKARKQFAAKYGRQTLNLDVFGKGRRVNEGKINADILSSIALEGPAHPYGLHTRMKAQVKKPHKIADQRTFRRHVKELHRLGYIKILQEEPHHAGRKRIYTLTEKGKTVVMFLPAVQEDLLTFMDLYDAPDRTATPVGRTIRLLLQKDVRTIVRYYVKTSNMDMLRYNFEDEQNEDCIRGLRLSAFATTFIILERKIRQKEKLPELISIEDAIKFNDALENDPEFRKTAIELTQGMKDAMDYFRRDVESSLNSLKELDNEK